MGGPVNGGQIFGQYPSLALGSSLDSDRRNRGRLIPTTSVDEYGSELARWLGVSGSEMDTVFPNIRNFYDPATITHPVGFFEIGKFLRNLPSGKTTDTGSVRYGDQ